MSYLTASYGSGYKNAPRGSQRLLDSCQISTVVCDTFPSQDSSLNLGESRESVVSVLILMSPCGETEPLMAHLTVPQR